MNNNEFNRLKTLAGMAPSSLTESKTADRARYDADDKADKKVTLKKAPWEKEDTKEAIEDLDEADKPDFADIDGDGDEEETAKKAAKDKAEKPAYPTNAQRAALTKKLRGESVTYTDAEMMREWANSIYKQYDSRGHYQEQPDGETVDLSLRRYLDAEPMKVSLEESVDAKAMLKEYRSFKGDKAAAPKRSNKKNTKLREGRDSNPKW